MKKNTAMEAVRKAILGVFSREHFYLDTSNRAEVVQCWNDFLNRKAAEGVITREQAAMWQKRVP
jgi:hypothetical protein